jgi:four helix bundle protein
MTSGASKVRSYRDLIVWQRATELVRETYRLTTRLPTQEMYGLTSQMRRAAVSIAANIAEGQARRATRDYVRFLSIANGSLRELETYWEVTADLELIGQAELAHSIRLGVEVGRMLTKLRESLQKKLDR